jgi:aspartyl-tRNA(Asn)/glutamyl-tRNA(Gln) amidotransferase subunit A
VPVNEAGLPAVAFPVGTAGNGLALGAQLIGRAHSDEHLLGVADYQDAHPPAISDHRARQRPGGGR